MSCDTVLNEIESKEDTSHVETKLNSNPRAVGLAT